MSRQWNFTIKMTDFDCIFLAGNASSVILSPESVHFNFLLHSRDFSLAYQKII